MIRVLLVEDQKLACEGLRLLIDREEDMVVAGQAADAEEAVANAEQLQPDVIVMDVDTQVMDCFQAIRQIRNVMSDPRIVFISNQCSDDVIGRALGARVLGFSMKQEGFDHLRNAIREAHAGEYHYARRVMDRVVTGRGRVRPGPDTKTRLQLLTPRERQLLRLLASGQSLKLACKSLKISYKTADKHKVNLMKKLGIHDRVELARYAIREKIVDP